MSTLSTLVRRYQRRRQVLQRIKPSSGLCLELGPLDKPVIKKSEARVFYVDIASTDDLRQRYEGDGITLADKICPVDFVWNGLPLRDIIPASLVFDYVIASHVIEHTFDMIGWLQEIASVMKAGGILSLAVPDKRFTFDLERETTTLEQLLKVHFERAAEGRESFRDHFQVFTFESFAATIGALCSDGVIPFHLLSLWRRSNTALEFIAILQRGPSER
jgi:SAM-dependent methyltransferase